MTKKLLSVLTTTAILGTMACASAVSTSAFTGEFKFEVTENLANANRFFYAHIWDGLEGGEGLYEWQTANEKMTWNKGDAEATYNIEKDGNWNLIIISGDSGFQTYDTVFNANCIGDTCYVLDEKFENPVDSKKTANGLAWRNNSDCGPHKVVSSLGGIIGTAFLPGESDQNLYNNFVKKYDPANGTNGLYDGDTYMDWSIDGEVETGKDWETIKKEVAAQLGVQVDSSSDNSSSNNSSSNNSSSNNSSSNNSSSNNSSSNNSSSNNSSSNGSSSSSNNSSSSTSTGTTTTGDSTPVVALFGTLAAALGVAFVARKKTVK